MSISFFKLNTLCALLAILFFNGNNSFILFTDSKTKTAKSVLKSPNDLDKLPNTQFNLLSKQTKDRVTDLLRLTAFTASSLVLSSIPVSAAENVKKTKKPKVLETELGIKYIELIKGSGPYPNSGDFIIISYTGFLSNGTVFDSTEVKGRKPLSFRFGKNQIIEGLESVVGNMQPGGQCTCNIPAKYAYGAKGVCIEKEGCLIPPNEDLKYAVKLISVGAGYN